MPRNRRIVLALAAVALAVACALDGSGGAARHRWWSGLGPVLPHDTFPADCSLCHVGREWRQLTDDFAFDHAGETGVALRGAHAEANCLRCHNDRGPVDVFEARGCAGCHEDVHQGELGTGCTVCHNESTWFPEGQVERHRRTRFPLVGAHASTSCRRCHIGAEVGNFLPIDTNCVTCHQDDLARTTNHLGLGWVERCDRCHRPTFWDEAEID